MLNIFFKHMLTIFSNISPTSFENSDVLRSPNVQHMLHETYVERMLRFYLLAYASLFKTQNRGHNKRPNVVLCKQLTI